MPFFFVCHSELILHVFAGAEVLDEQIQKDNDGIHEDDQERRVNAGGSPFAFFCQGVDLYGNKLPFGSNQQDNGGNRGDGPDKGSNQSGEEGILDEGRVTVKNTFALPAPRSMADSSILLSICRRAEMPLRVPVGRERTTKAMIRIAEVPYSPFRKPVRNMPLEKPRI